MNRQIRKYVESIPLVSNFCNNDDKRKLLISFYIANKEIIKSLCLELDETKKNEKLNILWQSFKKLQIDETKLSETSVKSAQTALETIIKKEDEIKKEIIDKLKEENICFGNLTEKTREEFITLKNKKVLIYSFDSNNNLQLKDQITMEKIKVEMQDHKYYYECSY